MSMNPRSLAALGAVLFALVGLSACGSSGIPSDAVVKVDSTPITQTAFKHWLKVALVSGGSGRFANLPVPEPPDYKACINRLSELAKTEFAAKKIKAIPTTATLKNQCAQQYKSLSQEVLGFLISSQWVVGEAGSLGVKLTDAEVKKQFVKIRTSQFPKAAEFEKFLSTSGQTVSDLLLRVKLNMLSQKIQQKVAKEKATVTQAQIQKYYNENKSKYGTPEKRSVQLVLTKTEEEAKKVKKEIEAGKSFAELAKRVSIDPTSKKTGGKLASVSKGQEEPTLDAALFAAKLNTLTGPVKSAFGYYVLEVLSSKGGTQQTLAQVSPSIKQQLQATQQQAALAKFVKDFKKKWLAKTDCRTGYIVADCKQYKAPKTTSGSTATSPTPTP